MTVHGAAAMSSRERLLTALGRGVPDRLPATTHHLMPAFLASQGGIGEGEFFDRYGLDAIRWTTPLRPAAGFRPDPQPEPATESWSLVSDTWRVERACESERGFRTVRYAIVTPRRTLTMVLQDDGRTTWVADRLMKEKADLDILTAISLEPACDLEAVASAAAALGERGLVRGAVPGFPVYGQPGCWQDAAVLFGIEPLIFATFDDPGYMERMAGSGQTP